MGKKLQPKLRFPEFNGDWEEEKIENIFEKIKNPVLVEEDKKYQQIGIRSHGKGIFYKEFIFGKELGNKRVFWIESNVFIVNIVFAWERAIAKTTDKELGMIASHRFPMYKPLKGILDLNFITYFFKTLKGQSKLELASPGGAGRNKTLGQKEFSQLKLYIPQKIKEQEKIASFILSVDENIEILEQKLKYLEKYKKGLIQKIFSQEIKFKDKDGNKFPNWGKIKLSTILEERRLRNTENSYTEVFSVAKSKGVVNQIEHLGRSYAGKNTSNYKVILPNDLIYTKSPTRDFPFGIIKQNLTNRSGIVSTLYAVYTPQNKNIGLLLHYYFLSFINTFNYLNPLVQKGAKNTMNINNKDFLNGAKIYFPENENEQQKIAEFLLNIDIEVEVLEEEIKGNKEFKKGLLQQMFI